MVTVLHGGEEAEDFVPDRAGPLGELPTRASRPPAPVGSVRATPFSMTPPVCAGVEARNENGFVLANLHIDYPRAAQVASTP